MTSNEFFILADGLGSAPNQCLIYNDLIGTVLGDFKEFNIPGNTLIMWNSLAALRGFAVQKIEADIVDLETLSKYYFGLSSRDLIHDIPSSTYRLLERHYADKNIIKDLYKKLHGLKSSAPIQSTDWENFPQKMANAYDSVKKEMISRGDWERFEKIEIPISKIFLSRSLIGISIDKEMANGFLDEIKDNYYKNLNALREEHQFNNFEISQASIKAYLNLAADDLQHYDLLNYLKSNSSRSVVYYIFNETLKNEYSKREIYQLLISSSERVYPSFDTSGTVTSRITTKDPNLQNIRKIFRKVIKPDFGRELIYLDYRCFEPTIMAYLSQDKKLIELCRSGDLYSEISALAGFPENRKAFKVAFLSYLYGMGKEKVIEHLSQSLGVANSQAKEIYNNIFLDFSDVEKWKKQIWRSTLKSGYSDSIFGNRRYRPQNTSSLSDKEKRWAVNQKIQGTASLILKQAIIDLYAKYEKDIDVLLPMHDAILLQVPPNYQESAIDDICNIMKKAFHSLLNGEVEISKEAFY